jgi:prepilin-type N-terminal cleavage/methylation domain-containing protein
MRRLFLSSLRQSPNGLRTTVAQPAAFTMIELLVVVVIVSVLASLSLAGLAGARQRSKIDKTRSTIRKIHELINPQYESYAARRLPNSIYTSSTNAIQRAADRLRAIRTLSLYEMPDNWQDVATSGTSRLLLSGTAIPTYAFTARTASYGALRSSISTTWNPPYPSSECLYMICSRLHPDAMDNFRSDEIGDIDNDKAPEFIDGWGNPIAFIRWPTGFVAPLSQIQIADSNLAHDPWDPMRVEQAAFSLTPLVYSAGPDTEYGLVQLNSWTGETLLELFRVSNRDNNQKPGEPDNDPASSGYYRDNITNHDLMSKR